MPHTVDAAFREELRYAGLPSQGALPRLLALLRASPDTHLTLAQVADMAAEAGLALSHADLARLLETLADHELLGRLPTTSGELIFDTVPQPHFHLVYAGSMEVVDLHVSAETLLVMLRQALMERPGGVEVLLRYRQDPATRRDGPKPGQ